MLQNIKNIWAWTKTQTTRFKDYLKQKTKKVLISLGILGVAVAASVVPAVLDIPPCIEDTKKSIHQRLQTCNIPANEVASFKGREIARQVKSVPKTLLGDYYIEIVKTEAVTNGVAVYTRAWDGVTGEQVGFGKDGTVDVEKFAYYFSDIDGYLLRDPVGSIVKDFTHPRTGVSYQVRYRDDVQGTILDSLVRTIAVVKELGGTHDSKNIVSGKIGQTTSTIEAHSKDENFEAGGSATWSDEQTASAADGFRGGGNYTDHNMGIYEDSNTWNLRRDSFYFQAIDTAVGSDTVDSATLTLYFTGAAVHSKDTSGDYFVIVATTMADPAAPVTGDFDQFGNIGNPETSGYGNTGINLADISGAGDDSLIFNSTGVTAISDAAAGSGNLEIGARLKDDSTAEPWTKDGTANTVSFASVEHSTNDPPRLIIIHSAAAAGGNKFLGEIILFGF